MAYRLLEAFALLFTAGVYNPRPSTQGDTLARELFEDLFVIAKRRRSRSAFVSRVEKKTNGVNPGNKIFARAPLRRGDGTFGEFLPSIVPRIVPKYKITLGSTATTEIGCEVKILATRMLGQIDRNINDLKKQVGEFRKKAGSRPPISVCVVGINRSAQYRSFVGQKVRCPNCGTHFPIHYDSGPGSRRRAPRAEAPVVLRRIADEALASYDFSTVLEFEAANVEPYAFAWSNARKTVREYETMLINLAAEYETRFR